MVGLSVPILFEGDPSHFPTSTVTTPGVLQTLINTVVPVDTRLDVWQLNVSCAFEGIFLITVDGTLIGSGRTGPGKGTTVFPWMPNQSADAGQTILVTFQSREGSPVAPIEAFLMCGSVSL